MSVFFGSKTLLLEVRRQRGKTGRDHDEIRIQRVYGLNETIDG
jgi:hypothetical protein